MITTFKFTVPNKSGVFTKILLFLNKRQYKVVDQHFRSSENPPAIYIDLESDSALPIEELYDIKQEVSDIQNVVEIRSSQQVEPIGSTLSTSKPASKKNDLRKYTGQNIEESLDAETQTDNDIQSDKKHVYRGQKFTEVEFKAPNQVKKNKPQYYRGQKIG